MQTEALYPHFEIRHIPRENYLRMKWKNGGGETLQIALSPAAVKFPEEPFLWRLSSALIASSGPFSEFPGYRRAIVLLKGSGLEMQWPSGQRQSVDEKSIFIFSGDERIQGTLTSGPVEDLNLIWNDREVVCHFKRVTRADLDTENRWTIFPAITTQTLLFYFVSVGGRFAGSSHVFLPGDTCQFERTAQQGRGILPLIMSLENLSEMKSDLALLYCMEIASLHA